ncbi:MAG: UvrD-helicase domain-containing protein [Phototrophicaceae bacterium]
MTSDLLNGLNPQQLQAVTTVEGPVLVLAGPGSGKTGVLTRRVAHLVRDIGVAPYQIMAVTFTNKAAAEMRHRVNNLLGERIRGLQIGTFHSTCARILRIEADATNYNQDYAIYDTDDQKTAVQQVMTELQIDPKKFSPRRVLGAISNAKNEMILPDNYVAQDYFTEIVSRVYPQYQLKMRNNNAMDFDDLLMQMVLLLKNNEVIRQKYQHRYPFVMVDEFQDTNTVQYQLVQLFAMPQNNVFVVGDEDQSIYAFRGADFRNVMRFRNDYPQAKVILLEQNYRSTQVVLDTARAIIDKNHSRTPKALFTERKGGELVTVKEAYDDSYEAQYIMEEIANLTEQQGYAYSDIAVMYRTNAQSRALENACRNYNVPYHLIGGTSFYQRREIKDLLAYLRVVNNPEDSVSFERVMKMQKGIGAKTLQAFFTWLFTENLSAIDGFTLLASGAKTSLKGRASTLFSTFAEQYMRWRDLIKTGELVQLFDTIRGDVDYLTHMYSFSDGEDQFNDRLDNITEMRGLIARYDEDELSLAEFLQDQLLMTDEDRVAEENDSADKVTMLTLHAAKGLEYPVVFITGLEEGLLPHQRSYEEPDGIEEERRLFYVGITRAKDKLYISYAFRRALYGGYSDMSEKSGFLFDIPEDVMTSDSSLLGAPSDTGYRKMTTWEQQKPTGLSRLANDLRKQSEKTGHVSDESIRSKIIAFPGGSVSNDPLKYKSGMRVMHPSFGVGTVIESKRVDGKEIVTVAFENKKFGIKKLDIEFAQMTTL